VEDAGASPSADRSQAPSAFRGFAECEPFEPEVLPSGAKPGEARPHPDEKPVDFMRAWGAGRDQVAVGWGQEMLDATGEEADDFAPQDWAPQQVVVKDGVRRVVIPIGDQGVGQIAVRFVMDDCPYSLWLPSGLDKEGRPWGYTLAEALEYAQRF
jgi:hypothetical protein